MRRSPAQNEAKQTMSGELGACSSGAEAGAAASPFPQPAHGGRATFRRLLLANLPANAWGCSE
eukprot:11543156-Alexandrium_andersonii.AAC.1